MQRLFVLCCTLCTLISFPILAQNSDHLSMQLDFTDSLVQVKATYHTTIGQKTDSLFVLLNPGLAIKKLEAKGLADYQLKPKAGRPFPFWRLQFDRSLEKGTTLDIHFEYSIDLAQQNHMKSNWIELNADKMWFPNLHDLDNAFSYELTISNLPESYTLLGHSDAKVSEEDGTIRIKKDKPWPEALILAGKNLQKWSYSQNLTIYGNQSIPDSTLQSIGEKVHNSIEFLNHTYGQPKPIKDFIVVLRNTTSQELGFQFNRRNLIVTGPDFNNYADYSHEIAHYWWSGADFIKEPWMNESFANYSMYLVLQEFNPELYERLYKRNAKGTEKAPPVAEAWLFTPDAYQSYYNKGAILLTKLEARISREKMLELLRLCVKKDIHSTAGFLEQLEKITSTKDRTFFEALLKQ